MLHDATPADLMAVLTSGRPFAALVGAGASGVRPSNLPLARPWVVHLLEEAARRTARPDLPAFQPPTGFGPLAELAATNRLVVPLEGIFQACEDAVPGLGARLAALVGKDVPVNSLVDLVVSSVVRAGGRVLTTNFDLLLEEAAHRYTGAVADVWVAGDPWLATAVVLKLHGSADRAATLRHTFRTVNEQFDDDTARRLRLATHDTLVVLGYAGADFDVIDVLDDRAAATLGPCYWLVRAGDDVPPGARTLAERRDVFVARGDFDDVLEAVGLPRAGFQPDGAAIWPATTALFDAIPPEAALDILIPVLYQARVGHPPAEPAFQALRAYLKEQVDDRRRYHRVEASEAQFVGGMLVQWLRATWHFVLAANGQERWVDYSHAAEALERVFYGLLVPVRILTLPVHRAATSRATGANRARLRTRWARGMSALGRHRRAIELLTQAETEIEHDTYHEGILRKRRALARALTGSPGWKEDVDKARRNFEFENRTVELGDLIRTEAACLFLAGRRDEGIRRMEDSRQMHLAYGQRIGAVRSAVLATAMQRTPMLVRAALWIT